MHPTAGTGTTLPRSGTSPGAVARGQCAARKFQDGEAAQQSADTVCEVTDKSPASEQKSRIKTKSNQLCD